MRAGKLRHRITLQMVSQQGVNAWGEPTVGDVWTAYDTVWASIRPLSGTERVAPQQAQAELTHEITLRYHKGVSVLHRIVYESRVFAINTIRDVDERKREMILQCTEQQEQSVI